MLSSKSAVAVRKTVMGTFDPETRWRDPLLSMLPRIPDPERDRIVLCMDELLFPLCGPNDILYSRCGIDEVLLDYFARLGVSFHHHSVVDLTSPEAEEALRSQDFASCIFKLAPQDGIPSFNADKPYVLAPYAVTEEAQEYAGKVVFANPLPDLAVVKRVNSKLYHHRLLEDTGLHAYGTPAMSAEEVEQYGTELLLKGAFLIKDLFGVSGKGNLLIESPSLLKRIVSYLRKQEEAGSQTLFLLEPLLPKAADFSSQWLLESDGSRELISVQRMINRQQNYGGSVTAEAAFVNSLEQKGYFRMLEVALRELHLDGYFGYVCFDSMVLEGGELVPIVEVNARMSMGLINAHLDRLLAGWSLKGWLTYLSVALPDGFRFDRLLQALEDEQLLFTPLRSSGIMPLSSGTLTVNGGPGGRSSAKPKGRLYVSVIGQTEETREVALERLKQVLHDLSVTVFH
ncbi:hypothetical protein SAMN04487970_102354 [Paenibacillus tianmuensis]|uniref:ATP-grasp domain-containing protein n=1 Tax=Paenibacillus tianmuensis TaxID=624147 RepID=A0A1G4S672_9BACL|nr:hypothetical protein [Paenibacillus tianmuensis]SCW64526.1 hypothetical protein SAMN04487970_102354 [Paenibacillus tianmuensis]